MKTGTNCILGSGENEGVLEKGGENGVEIAPDLDVLGSRIGCFGGTQSFTTI
jgi:hypothetical protein